MQLNRVVPRNYVYLRPGTQLAFRGFFTASESRIIWRYENETMIPEVHSLRAHFTPRPHLAGQADRKSPDLVLR